MTPTYPTRPVSDLFGCSYDKTLLTEYAGALDHGRVNMLESHALAAYLEQYAGGLKGLVRDMRQARRKEKPAAASRTDAARKKLRSTVALKPEEVTNDEPGLAITAGRRAAYGSPSLVGGVEGEQEPAERERKSGA